MLLTMRLERNKRGEWGVAAEADMLVSIMQCFEKQTINAIYRGVLSRQCKKETSVLDVVGGYEIDGHMRKEGPRNAGLGQTNRLGLNRKAFSRDRQGFHPMASRGKDRITYRGRQRRKAGFPETSRRVVALQEVGFHLRRFCHA